MPVREKALSTALAIRMEGKSYYFINNPRNPIAVVDGEEMPREKFDEQYWDLLERIFERVVDSIDWNRVMIEAETRHIALEGRPDHERCEKFAEDHGHGFGPDCLCEALLCDETHSDWRANPKAPRYHQ